MVRRFQIEDIIVQDATGVVFHALDSETGKSVAVRRFFPFGADGGGLHADEQAAYEIAVERLSCLSHPALRSVICGGCDPVDGMPFIATEWVEGASLDVVMGDATLPVEVATLLITQALEVSELLSHVLAEEAVWVETSLQTIVVSQKESGRGFTFWISPLKWLGNPENRGLESIITLTEQVMGWSGRIINDQAGKGLGGWLKWLRGAAATTTLHEAREMLAASVGAEPPQPAGKLVAQAAVKPIRPLKPASSKIPVVSAFVLGLVVISLGGWFLTRNSGPAPVAGKAASKTKSAPAFSRKADAPATARPAGVSEETARANQLAIELSAEISEREKQTAATLEQQKAAVAAKGGIYSPDHRELLFQQLDNPVAVEGLLGEIDFSGGGKTLMYLVFSGTAEKHAARGKIVIAEAAAGLSKEDLQPLIGQKIRIKGMVEPQVAGDSKRPLIVIKDRASIEVLPP